MKLKSLSAALVMAASATFGTQAQANGFAACLQSAPVTFDGTIVDAAVATPALSTLVDLVTAAGLAETLATTEDITVYAPTNDAFAAIPEPVLNAIGGDVDLLTSVLTYHVSPGLRDPRFHFTAVERPTLQGANVYFDFNNGRVRVNQSEVSCTGVRTDNGLVWIIDSVLLPQF